VAGDNASAYVKRVCGRGQTHASQRFGGRTGQGTLLLSDLRFAHKTHKTRVGGTALRIVHSRFRKAQIAIHRAPNLRRIVILLTVVIPPAHRHKARVFGASRVRNPQHGHRKAQRYRPHTRIDEVFRRSVYNCSTHQPIAKVSPWHATRSRHTASCHVRAKPRPSLFPRICPPASV
jgi:hypothetical protein